MELVQSSEHKDPKPLDELEPLWCVFWFHVHEHTRTIPALAIVNAKREADEKSLEATATRELDNKKSVEGQVHEVANHVANNNKNKVLKSALHSVPLHTYVPTFIYGFVGMACLRSFGDWALTSEIVK